MYLLILFLPLCGSITAGLLGRKLGPSGAHFTTISSLATASILALLAFYEVAICDSPVTINLGSWLNSDLLNINWLFYFDQLSVTMLVVVSVVSLMVHIYSIYYMTGEPHQQRFFSYLSLFTFFMLVLVSGGNYLILFLGWEGIGVSSYLLINYYYTRLASNKAAILAFNQNRVGDWILSVGFFAMISVFGSLDYDVIFNLAPSINPQLITIICLFLFIGAGAKSSVLGLHSWLPGSMEAPTPVSSLLHAATYFRFLLLCINPPVGSINSKYNKPSDTYLIICVFTYSAPNSNLICESFIGFSTLSLTFYQITNIIGLYKDKNRYKNQAKGHKSAQNYLKTDAAVKNTSPVKNTNPFSFQFNRYFSSQSKDHEPNHIKPILNNSNTKIPWKTTSSNINALNSIIQFYEWLPKTSPVKLFIENHCNYLLSNKPNFLGREDTNILVTYFDAQTILNKSINKHLWDCSQLKSAYLAFEDPQQSYLYCFINKETKRRYIGSTINPVSRLHNYIHSWETNRQRFLQEMRTTGKGFDNYLFYSGFQAPNYLNLFTQLHPNFVLEPTSKLILNSLSEFHIKLLEQSVISFIKPEINDLNTAVSFTFSSINISNYTTPQNKFKSHSISVYDKNGNLFNSYESINQAKIALGITDSVIRWSRNRTNYLIYCPKPDMELLIRDETLNELTTNVPLSHHQKLANITDDFLNNLASDLLYVYLEDRKTIYGTFKTASEFAKLHNLNPWQAYRYVNKEYLINIKDPNTDNIVSVYLFANPSYLKTLLDIQDKQNWPVVSIDTAEKDFVRYHDNPNQAREELSALIGEFELKPTRNFTSNYITGVVRKGIKQNPSKFKNRFILKWFKDFDNTVELEKGS